VADGHDCKGKRATVSGSFEFLSLSLSFDEGVSRCE
jgi:hypothetical protein